jgi:hypothetical protein
MPFTTVRGLKGKVYVPDQPKEGSRKHSCKDCYSCQLCSDDRCAVVYALTKSPATVKDLPKINLLNKECHHESHKLLF